MKKQTNSAQTKKHVTLFLSALDPEEEIFGRLLLLMKEPKLFNTYKEIASWINKQVSIYAKKTGASSIEIQEDLMLMCSIFYALHMETFKIKILLGEKFTEQYRAIIKNQLEVINDLKKLEDDFISELLMETKIRMKVNKDFNKKIDRAYKQVHKSSIRLQENLDANHPLITVMASDSSDNFDGGLAYGFLGGVLLTATILLVRDGSKE